jgi:hypothetical protein
VNECDRSAGAWSSIESEQMCMCIYVACMCGVKLHHYPAGVEMSWVAGCESQSSMRRLFETRGRPRGHASGFTGGFWRATGCAGVGSNSPTQTGVADKKQVREPTYLHCGRVRYTAPGNEVDRSPKKSVTRKMPSGVEGSQASWSGGEAGGEKKIGE